MRYIQPIIGEYTGMKYWLVSYPEGDFGWQYTFKGQVYGRDYFETANEAIKDIKRRENALANGESVMI